MDKKQEQPLLYDVLKKDYLFINGIIGALGLLVFLAMVLQRADLIPNMPCILHDVFRIYCPGCGGTRAIFALLKGNVVESFCSNPLIIIGGVLVLYYEIGVAVTLLKRNGKRYYTTSIVPVIIFAVIAIVFTVVRNYLLIACGIDLLQDFRS